MPPLHYRRTLWFLTSLLLFFTATRGAGLKTIITVNDYTRDHDFSDALIVLDQFGEPGAPFQVLSGTLVNGASYLDLSLVRALFAA